MLSATLSLPGVTAPGMAVICGAVLVIFGFEVIGAGTVLFGLLVYARVHTTSPSE